MEKISTDYCPHCGKTTLKFPDERKWQCTDCGFVVYNNVAAAVAVILRFQEEIMLTVRAKNPGLGLLDLPGGFTDFSESAEETCYRELQEELGVDFRELPTKYLASLPNEYPYKGIPYRTLDLFYEISLAEKFQPKLQTEEISSIAWVKVKDLDLSRIAFESQRRFLENYR